jgi:hypothetical protein
MNNIWTVSSNSGCKPNKKIVTESNLQHFVQVQQFSYYTYFPQDYCIFGLCPLSGMLKIGQRTDNEQSPKTQ